MNFQTIIKNDLINGEGIRCSLFVSGCSHGCDGCFNEDAWDYRSGSVFGKEQIDIIYNEMKKDYIDGISLLGGDPLMPKHIDNVIDLCRDFKNKFPSKTIWCWTGYTLEEVQNNHACGILEFIDVLVDGKYIEKQRNLQLQFRGSSNQQILKKGIHF